MCQQCPRTSCRMGQHSVAGMPLSNTGKHLRVLLPWKLRRWGSNSVVDAGRRQHPWKKTPRSWTGLYYSAHGLPPQYKHICVCFLYVSFTHGGDVNGPHGCQPNTIVCWIWGTHISYNGQKHAWPLFQKEIFVFQSHLLNKQPWQFVHNTEQSMPHQQAMWKKKISIRECIPAGVVLGDAQKCETSSAWCFDLNVLWSKSLINLEHADVAVNTVCGEPLSIVICYGLIGFRYYIAAK